jgi:hypothetical protein
MIERFQGPASWCALVAALAVGAFTWQIAQETHTIRTKNEQDIADIKARIIAVQNWANEVDGENGHLRYLKPLATKYDKYRKSYDKKAAAEKAASEWGK